jgi:hypothetical protein
MRQWLFLFIWIFLSIGISVAQDNELPTASRIAWHPSGDFLAIGGDALWLYDSNFALIETELLSHILEFAWSPDGSMLLVLQTDGNIPGYTKKIVLLSFVDGIFADMLWTVEYTFESPLSRFGFAWHPDSAKFVIVNEEAESFSTVTVDGELTEFGEQDFDFVTSVAWHPDGSVVAIEVYGVGVTLWDAETGEFLRILLYAAEGLLSSGIHFNSDGTQLIAGTVIPASLHVWDVETGDYIFEPDTSGDVSAVLATIWSPDDSFVVYKVRMAESCSFGGITIVDAQTWSMESEIYTPISACIYDFDLMPDGKALTVLDYDGYLYQWQIGSEEVRRIEGIQFESQEIM